MAIHRIVLYSPDRRWRITADPRGNRFTIEHDLVLATHVSSLPEVEAYLKGHGIALADLEQD